MYILLGQHLSEGSALYRDAWFAGPPLLPWLFGFAQNLFGSWSLPVIRVLTCLYVYLIAVVFNGILIEYKLFRTYTGAPAVLFAFLVSVPWYGQQMSSSLFILLPTLLCFSNLMLLGEQRSRNYRLMFIVGVWMGLSIAATYNAFLILLGLIVAYIRIRNPRMDEIVALLGGISTIGTLILLILYFNDSLVDFWNIGIRYFLAKPSISLSPVYQSYLLQTLIALAISWGLALLLAIVGFLHFRLKYFSYVVKVRATETIMSMWVVGVLLLFVFKWQRLELSDWVLLSPPLVFYARKALDFEINTKLRVTLLAFMVMMPLSLYLGLWNIRNPNSTNLFQPTAEDVWVHGNAWPLLEQEGVLFQILDELPKDASIWIMDYRPEWYMALGKKYPNKYADFRIVYHTFPLFQNQQSYRTAWQEPEREFFREFQKHSPDLIIDPKHNFPLLQERYPRLLGRYQEKEVGEFHLYRKSN